MKITGYALREAIKQHQLRMDTLARSFNGSLKVFPGESKESPAALVESFLQEERAIAQLQVAQMRFNLAVFVQFQGGRISLAEAIKRIGGVARAEKMWRSAAGPKEDRFGYHNEDVRDVNQIRATSTVTPNEAVKNATSIAKQSGALRAAIAVANATEVEIEDLDSALIE